MSQQIVDVCCRHGHPKITDAVEGSDRYWALKEHGVHCPTCQKTVPVTFFKRVDKSTMPSALLPD